MSGAWLGWGLVAAAMLPSTARAAETSNNNSSRPDMIADTPVWSLDMGAGMMQPGYTNTTFGSLDTWNGQHTLYQANGASLGVAHPIGWSFWGALHVFPLPVRVVGLVTTMELGGFGANMTTGQTSFGAIDPSTNFYLSFLGGPEAQLRVSSFLFRAAALGGTRYTTVANFSALEWRVALRGQIDYSLVGDVRRGDTALTLGVFGAGDVIPAPGWSTGFTLSLSFL